MMRLPILIARLLNPNAFVYLNCTLPLKALQVGYERAAEAGP